MPTEVPWAPVRCYFGSGGLVAPRDRPLGAGSAHSLVSETLMPGGMLVIDERNFQNIVDNKALIDRDPIVFKEDWGGVMYRGNAVHGCPTLIETSRRPGPGESAQHTATSDLVTSPITGTRDQSRTGKTWRGTGSGRSRCTRSSVGRLPTCWIVPGLPMLPSIPASGRGVTTRPTSSRTRPVKPAAPQD